MKTSKSIIFGYSNEDATNKAFKLASGGTAERPGESHNTDISAENGMIRYNDETRHLEGYIRDRWTDFVTDVDIMPPSLNVDENENVTIASLSTLLRQFMTTYSGGVEFNANRAPMGTTPEVPGSGKLVYITQPYTNAGQILGYNEDLGENFVNVLSNYRRPNYTNSGTIPPYGFYDGTGGESYPHDVPGRTHDFIANIDAFKLSGMDDAERYNYTFNAFSVIYKGTNYTSAYGAGYGGGSYRHGMGVTHMIPLWNPANPKDPNYGVFKLWVMMFHPTGSAGTNSAECNLGIRWFVRMTRFKNFRLVATNLNAPTYHARPMPSVVTIDLSSDTLAFNVRRYLIQSYPDWDKVTPVNVFLRIHENVTVNSTGTLFPSLEIGDLPVGSTVKIINKGVILGPGGQGGSGGGYIVNSSNEAVLTNDNINGQDGGTAFKTGVAVTVDNENGQIIGPGGGGGAAPYRILWNGTAIGGGGGGGGGGLGFCGLGGKMDNIPQPPLYNLDPSDNDGHDGTNATNVGLTIYNGTGGTGVQTSWTGRYYGSQEGGDGGAIHATLGGLPGQNAPDQGPFEAEGAFLWNAVPQAGSTISLGDKTWTFRNVTQASATVTTTGYVKTVSLATQGQYTSTPSVSVGGGNAIVSFNIELESVTIYAGGTGYSAGQTLTLVNGGNVGTTAATVTVSAVDGTGAITAISIAGRGTYTNITNSNNVATTGGTGTGVSLNAKWRIKSGSLTLTNGGSGYSGANNSTVNITFTGGGTGAVQATGTATISRKLGTVNIISQGAGYTVAPTVTIGGSDQGDGTAVITAVLGTGVNAGKVISYTITNAGSGFTTLGGTPIQLNVESPLHAYELNCNASVGADWLNNDIIPIINQEGLPVTLSAYNGFQIGSSTYAACMLITYNTTGTVGNSFAISASATSNAFVPYPTLTGGTSTAVPGGQGGAAGTAVEGTQYIQYHRIDWDTGQIFTNVNARGTIKGTEVNS